VYVAHKRSPRAKWPGSFSSALRTYVVVVTLASATPLVSAQSTTTLALDEALRLAQQRSGQLAGQAAAATAAREMAVAAGRLPDPVLKVGINNLPVNGADAWSTTRDFMTMRSIALTQEFTRAEKRTARTARFEREGDTAEAGRQLALSNLQRATASAWLDRYYTERVVDLLGAQYKEAELQVDAAEASYRGGRGSQADVMGARSAAVLIGDRIRQAESQLANAKVVLARWIGDAAARPLAAPPAVTVTRLSTEHLESSLAHHPELALMQRQEEVARAEADIAQANRRTDWSVELMYSQRGPAYSNMVSLNVSVPLQWDQKNRQQREVAARLAQAEQVRTQREEATREHLAETRRWIQSWQANLQRLAQYDRTVVPLAAQRTAAALAAYRGGSTPLAALLDARRSEIEVGIDRLRLEMETATLWAQLEYLIPAFDGEK
jgi:outer membrane protein TolC